MKHTVQAGNAGKYDQICERLGLDLKAAAVVLIVVDGRHGNGMSVCIDPKGEHADIGGGAQLAELLRRMAEMIEAGERPDGTRLTATDEVAS